MIVSNEYKEEYGIPENYEGKVIEIHHIDGDDDINDFIEETGNDTIKVLINNQEDDYLWGDLTDGTDFPYHITIGDIGMGAWVV